MGAWGYYDDENDNTMDNWIEIERLFYPKELLNAEDVIEEIDPNLFEYIKNKYLFKNLDFFYNTLIAFTKRLVKDKKKSIQIEPDSDIVGILLFAVRKLSNIPNSNIMGIYKGNNLFPTSLPKNFPNILREYATESIMKMLDDLDENLLGWENLDDREIALNEELNLFSKGIKQQKKSNSKKKSNSNNKRPSPSISAQDNPNKIKKGNDGNLWISKENINGIYQWKKLK